VQRHPLAEFGQIEVGELDVPAHRQVGTVDLQVDAGGRDRLIFVAQPLGDREQIFLVAPVIFVAEKQRRDARRGRAHERRPALRRRLQPHGVAARRLHVLDADRPGAGRRPAPRPAGVAEHLRLGAGKVLEVLEGVAGTGAAEAVQPVLDVGRVARLRHFAVVGDVDPRRGLALDHQLGGGVDRRLERGTVYRHAFFLGEHHPHQPVRPRQAAGMGGKEALGTACRHR
jgi:hypothetical protein